MFTGQCNDGWISCEGLVVDIFWSSHNIEVNTQFLVVIFTDENNQAMLFTGDHANNKTFLFASSALFLYFIATATFTFPFQHCVNHLLLVKNEIWWYSLLFTIASWCLERERARPHYFLSRCTTATTERHTYLAAATKRNVRIVPLRRPTTNQGAECGGERIPSPITITIIGFFVIVGCGHL